MMNNDNGNHDARISCEETTTEDMGPATWANEPKEPFYADAKAEFGDPRSEPSEAQPEPTTHKEAYGRCEDAPCCGCCGDEGPSYDDVADSYAADAFHDANEYPDW